MKRTERSNIWAEINLHALAHNIRQLKRFAPPHRYFIAVVKADAYGHGAVPVARKAVAAGAHILAVAVIDEADELRSAGIKTPIMVMSRTLPGDIPRIIKGTYIQNIGSLEEARQLSRVAAKKKKRIRVHIEVDTGMSRLGIPADEAYAVVSKIMSLPGLVPEGILTHLADADVYPSSPTRRQQQRFVSVVRLLELKGYSFKYIHYANSGGIINAPETLCNTVRPGISLYGYAPGVANRKMVSLRPLLTLKTRVIAVRNLAKGTAVSYGGTWVAPKACRIAVLSAGYGDGYPRSFSNTGQVVVRGKKVPVVGRVCMNHILVRVDNIPNISIGDVATLYGGPKGKDISVEKAAAAIGSIPYELTCRISSLVQRIYTGSV